MKSWRILLGVVLSAAFLLPGWIADVTYAGQQEPEPRSKGSKKTGSVIFKKLSRPKSWFQSVSPAVMEKMWLDQRKQLEDQNLHRSPTNPESFLDRALRTFW
jgi:hypothetical protein